MSKRTPAHRAADKRYSEKTARLYLRFNLENQNDLLRFQWLSQQKNKTLLIKNMIDDKMKNHTEN